MNFKENTNPPIVSPEQEISDKLKENVDSYFSRGEKLYRDALNFWSIANIGLIKGLKEESRKSFIGRIEPILHYGEAYRSKTSRYLAEIKNRPETEAEAAAYAAYAEREVARIMELSDKDSVRAYNELVDEFNEELKSLKEDFRMERLEYYAEKLKELFG